MINIKFRVKEHPLTTFGTFCYVLCNLVFFTFQILIFIGCVSTSPGLPNLNFAHFEKGDRNENFGLWSSCGNTINNNATSVTCTPTQGAFNWATHLSLLDSSTENVVGLQGLDGYFMAIFILYWIAFGSTALGIFYRVCCLPLYWVIYLVNFILIEEVFQKMQAAVASDLISASLGPLTWFTLVLVIIPVFKSIILLCCKQRSTD